MDDGGLREALRRGIALGAMLCPLAALLGFLVHDRAKFVGVLTFAVMGALLGLATTPLVWLERRAVAYRPSIGRTTLVASTSFSLAYVSLVLVSLQARYSWVVLETGDLGNGAAAVARCLENVSAHRSDLGLLALAVLPVVPWSVARVHGASFKRQVVLVGLAALLVFPGLLPWLIIVVGYEVAARPRRVAVRAILYSRRFIEQFERAD